MKSIFDVEFNFVGQDNFKKYFQNLKSYTQIHQQRHCEVYFLKDNKYVHTKVTLKSECPYFAEHHHYYYQECKKVLLAFKGVNFDG